MSIILNESLDFCTNQRRPSRPSRRCRSWNKRTRPHPVDRGLCRGEAATGRGDTGSGTTAQLCQLVAARSVPGRRLARRQADRRDRPARGGSGRNSGRPVIADRATIPMDRGIFAQTFKVYVFAPGGQWGCRFASGTSNMNTITIPRRLIRADLIRRLVMAGWMSALVSVLYLVLAQFDAVRGMPGWRLQCWI